MACWHGWGFVQMFSGLRAASIKLILQKGSLSIIPDDTSYRHIAPGGMSINNTPPLNHPPKKRGSRCATYNPTTIMLLRAAQHLMQRHFSCCSSSLSVPFSAARRVSGSLMGETGNRRFHILMLICLHFTFLVVIQPALQQSVLLYLSGSAKEDFLA